MLLHDGAEHPPKYGDIRRPQHVALRKATQSHLSNDSNVRVSPSERESSGGAFANNSSLRPQHQVGQEGEMVGREGVIRLNGKNTVIVDAPFRVYQDAIDAPQADAIQLKLTPVPYR